MRKIRRPRRYVARHWLTLMRPVLRYSKGREAYVLRVVGGQIGPVLRIDRRPRQQQPFDGVERRRTSVA